MYFAVYFEPSFWFLLTCFLFFISFQAAVESQLPAYILSIFFWDDESINGDRKYTIIYFLSHFISKGLFEVFEKPALTHILWA